MRSRVRVAEQRRPFRIVLTRGVGGARVGGVIDEVGFVRIGATGMRRQNPCRELPSVGVVEGCGDQIQSAGIDNRFEWCAERPTRRVGSDGVGVAGGALVLCARSVDWQRFFETAGDQVVLDSAGRSDVVGVLRVLAGNALGAIEKRHQMRRIQRVCEPVVVGRIVETLGVEEPRLDRLLGDIGTRRERFLTVRRAQCASHISGKVMLGGRDISAWRLDVDERVVDVDVVDGRGGVVRRWTP